MNPSLAQANRAVERLKKYLQNLDARYEAIQVSVPTVVVGKGMAAMQASLIGLSAFELPPELTTLPAEGQALVERAAATLAEVEARYDLLLACTKHLDTGEPLDADTGLSTAARIARSGSLAGAAPEVAATARYMAENLALVKGKLDKLKETKFRRANAIELAHLNNRVKYLSALSLLARSTPNSVLDSEVIDATAKAVSTEFNNLSAAHRRYYSKEA